MGEIQRKKNGRTSKKEKWEQFKRRKMSALQAKNNSFTSSEENGCT